MFAFLWTLLTVTIHWPFQDGNGLGDGFLSSAVDVLPTASAPSPVGNLNQKLTQDLRCIFFLQLFLFHHIGRLGRCFFLTPPAKNGLITQTILRFRESCFDKCVKLILMLCQHIMSRILALSFGHDNIIITLRIMISPTTTYWAQFSSLVLLGGLVLGTPPPPQKTDTGFTCCIWISIKAPTPTPGPANVTWLSSKHFSKDWSNQRDLGLVVLYRKLR